MISSNKGGFEIMINWINETLEKVDKKLSRTSVIYKDFIPSSIDENGKFTTSFEKSPAGWTNGFWGGLMWLMYTKTNKDCYLEAAKSNEKMLDKAFEYTETLDHDNGFRWEITSGRSYEHTGDGDSRKRVMLAANLLMGRYNPLGDYLVSWSQKDRQGWAIIDCMMNLPLLYKASEISEYERFREIAIKHADKTMKHHIRPDGSSNHIVVYDTKTGEYVESLGGQGMDANSSWSRGQAWAVYGFALSYKHTKNQEYLDTAKKVAHYFIANVSITDYIPKTDFRSPDEPDKRDTSAGLIAAAGMMEIAEHVPEYEKDIYVKHAYNLVKAIVEKYADWTEDYDGIIKNGMIQYKSPSPTYLPYGDYYLADALYRLKEYFEK